MSIVIFDVLEISAGIVWKLLWDGIQKIDSGCKQKLDMFLK